MHPPASSVRDAGRPSLRAVGSLFAAGLLGLVPTAHPEEAAPSPEQLRRVQSENSELRALLDKQQQVIEALGRRVTDLEARPQTTPSDSTAEAPRRSSIPNLIISGEGAVAFLHSARRGAWPNGEFRVDEARLFFDARIYEDLYLFSEVNLITRETNPTDHFLEIGELYLEWENIGALWGWEKAVNVRVGRVDIPFGEEYLHRDAIDNVLVTHSVADIWGVDEGLEIYGTVLGLQYVAAVQSPGTLS